MYVCQSMRAIHVSVCVLRQFAALSAVVTTMGIASRLLNFFIIVIIMTALGRCGNDGLLA